MAHIKPSLTDVVKNAALTTHQVYMRNAGRLYVGNPDRHVVIATEMKRATLMAELAADDNLCEMLAGRINQFLQSTEEKED